MQKRLAITAMCALALGAAPDARSATDAEIAEIRTQLKELRDSYEARIGALERKLKEAETRAAGAASPSSGAEPVAATAVAGQPAPASASVESAPAPSGNAPAGIAAFNPAISAVLQGTYANHSQDPNQYRIAGFVPSGDIAPAKRSFSIAESELNLSASVDDRFYGALIFSLTPDDTVSVEEAYGLYTAAPYGLAPKFGRFFSGIGYLNEQHQHVWDFYDAPLVYQAFLGGQFSNDGLQLKWVAPTDLYIEAGGELGSGSAFPGNDRNKNGIGNGTAYVHFGGDVGDSSTWRAGLSYLHTGSIDRTYSQEDRSGGLADLAFSGHTDLAIADLVWKWAPNGNARERNAKLQGEYFWRRENGDLSYASPTESFAQTAPYHSTQSGFYIQGVYQIMPAWRVGARYDWLDGGNVDYGVNSAYLGNPSFNPQRTTVMVDWTPSEFSRLRLQFQQAKLVPGQTDNELFLQYILTLGAHGAHKY
jgi:hypothetical protein